MALSAKLVEIMENEENKAEIEALNTHEETVKYFADRGIDIDKEFADNASDELDEDALDDVAGGSVFVAAAVGWMVGRTVGIAARRTYDKIKYGNANLTYSGYGLGGKKTK